MGQIFFTLNGSNCTRCGVDLQDTGIGLIAMVDHAIRDFTAESRVLCPACAQNALIRCPRCLQVCKTGLSYEQRLICETCRGTGYVRFDDDESMKLPTAFALPDPAVVAAEICAVQPMPDDTFAPVRSACCDADTFLADGRQFCSRCRLSRNF